MTLCEKVKSYSVLENIKSHMLIPYYENQIYPDAFTFSESTGIIHVNSTTAKAGYLYDSFEGMTLGDIVEVTVDVRSLSGVLPRIAFDEYNSPTTYQNVEYTQATKVGEWETLKFKYVFRDLKGFKKIRCIIGLWTADAGEFQMRNLRIGLKTKRNYEDEKSFLSKSFEIKPYEIRKRDGIWEIREDFATGGGSISVLSSNQLGLTFLQPFQKRPVSAGATDFYMESWKFSIKIGDAQKTGVKISIFDADTNKAQQLDAIPNDTHFSIILVG